MKKKILIICFIIIGVVLLTFSYINRNIGIVSGAENEYILIDNIKYIKDYSDEYQNYGHNDKGKYLGNVTNSGDTRIKVYSVKDDDEGKFIYTLWGHEGCFYVREDVYLKEQQGATPSETLEDQDEKLIKEAYLNVLKDLYYKYTLPDGAKLHYEDVESPDYYDMTQNQFALYDFDFDGSDELIISLTNPPMAAMVANIYDFNSGTNTLELMLSVFPAIKFYDNGIVEGLWSHNQGLAGDALWPYTMFKYNKETSSYDVIAQVDAWDKSLNDTNYKGEVFPDEIDKDNDGVLYYITTAGENNVETLADYNEYEKWRNEYISDKVTELEIPYKNLTKENIEVEEYRLSKEYELGYVGYDQLFNVALINNNYELYIANDKYTFESDGKEYIIECSPINENRLLEVLINGKKVEIPGYGIKGVAVIDLNPNDNSKELVIRESQDGFWKNAVYKLNENNEIDLSTRFVGGELGIYQIEDKYIFPVTLLASKISPVIGYYIYNEGEFKYIERCLTGEKTVDEEGLFPEKIREKTYVFSEELSNVYKDEKNLKEIYSIRFLNTKLEYDKENEKLIRRCDIELMQDAKYGEVYKEASEVLPQGTILKDVIFEDWEC